MKKVLAILFAMMFMVATTGLCFARAETPEKRLPKKDAADKAAADKRTLPSRLPIRRLPTRRLSIRRTLPIRRLSIRRRHRRRRLLTRRPPIRRLPTLKKGGCRQKRREEVSYPIYHIKTGTGRHRNIDAPRSFKRSLNNDQTASNRKILPAFRYSTSFIRESR